MSRQIFLPSIEYKMLIMIFISLIFSIIPFPAIGIFIPWFIVPFFILQINNDYKFTPIFLFLITLTFDFFAGSMVGLLPLLLLLTLRFIYNKRFILRGQSFSIQCISFAIICFIIFTLYYILLSLFSLNLLPIRNYLLDFVFLTALYPVFSKIYHQN
jgi:hypothetical protein